jgi:hypothetical protein
MPITPAQTQKRKRIVYGARAIGEVIDASEQKVYTLFASGALGDAVKKLGRRTLIGSVPKLEQLFFGDEC